MRWPQGFASAEKGESSLPNQGSNGRVGVSVGGVLPVCAGFANHGWPAVAAHVSMRARSGGSLSLFTPKWRLGCLPLREQQREMRVQLGSRLRTKLAASIQNGAGWRGHILHRPALRRGGHGLGRGCRPSPRV